MSHQGKKYTGRQVQTFKLIPFPVPETPSIAITGTVARRENLLSIHYSVQGDIENIRVPAQSNFPTREHGLWKATCFELFLAIKDQPRYWEFNLSPSNNWNVYTMDAYRQVNMHEENAFSQLPFEFIRRDEELSLDVTANLSSILQLEHVLQTGITTIIQTQDGNETYWALAHPAHAADFHLRESFVIEL